MIIFILLAVPLISAPPSPVTLSNVELVTVDEEFASVTWVTNLQSDTTIQWGTTEDLGEEYHVSETTNYHMGKMEDLVSGTTYFFQVSSDEVYSDISSFTTQTDPGGQLFVKFAIISDPHYDVDGANSASGNMNEEGPRLLASCVDEINNDQSIDFAILLGDLTNGAEEDYNGFASTINNLNAPWYPVLGNWDKNEDNWANYYDTYMGRTETYYTLDSGDYHIIILDSSETGQVNGKFQEEQMIWLENDLDLNSQKPTLIFMHHMADRTDEFLGLEQDSQDRLLSILSQHPQVLSLHSGHIHQNILTYAEDETNLAYASTVQYPMGYDIVKLYEGGYTQAFYKIESELETSEESRVRVNTNSGDQNADEEYLGSLNERSIIAHIPGNEPPTISDVSLDSETIKPGESVTITVTASDPDGDSLTYHYDYLEGTILGAGKEVEWQAPDKVGEYMIKVWVSDGEKSSNKDSVVIFVAGGSGSGEEEGTPGFDSVFLIISMVVLTIGLKAKNKRNN
jgi:predicted phosphodiesterase